MCWTLGLCGRVMVVVVLPFVWWLLSDRGMKPAWVVPGFASGTGSIGGPGGGFGSRLG